MASLLAPALGSQVPRTKKSPRRDAERRCRVPLFPGDPGSKPRPLPSAPFGVPSPLNVEGRKLKTHLARRRGNAKPWLFEIRIRKIFARRRNTLRVIRGLDSRI